MTVYSPHKEYYDDGGTVSELKDLDSFMVSPTTTLIQYANDGQIMAFFRSSHTATCNVVVSSVADPLGRTGDLTYTIPIGSVTVQMALVPFLDPSMFNAGGYVTITLEATTAITFALIRFRRRA